MATTSSSSGSSKSPSPTKQYTSPIGPQQPNKQSRQTPTGIPSPSPTKSVPGIGSNLPTTASRGGGGGSNGTSSRGSADSPSPGIDSSVPLGPQGMSQAAQDSQRTLVRQNVDSARNALQRDQNYTIATSNQSINPVNNFSKYNEQITPALEFGSLKIGTFDKSNTIQTLTGIRRKAEEKAYNENIRGQFLNLSQSINSDPYRFANQTGVTKSTNESGTFFTFDNTFIENNINKTQAEVFAKSAGKEAIGNVSTRDKIILGGKEVGIAASNFVRGIGQKDIIVAQNFNPTVKSGEDIVGSGNTFISRLGTGLNPFRIRNELNINTPTTTAKVAKPLQIATDVSLVLAGSKSIGNSIKTIGGKETAIELSKSFLPFQIKTGVFTPELTTLSEGKGVALKSGNNRIIETNYATEGIKTRDIQKFTSNGKGFGVQTQTAPFVQVSKGGADIKLGTRTTKSVYTFEQTGQGSGFKVKSVSGYVNGKGLELEQVTSPSLPASSTRSKAYPVTDIFKTVQGDNVLSTKFVQPIAQKSNIGSITKTGDQFSISKVGKITDRYSAPSNQFKQTINPKVTILEYDLGKVGRSRGSSSGDQFSIKKTSGGNLGGFRVINNPQSPIGIKPIDIKTDIGKGISSSSSTGLVQAPISAPTTFTGSTPVIQVNLPKTSSASVNELGGVYSTRGLFTGQGRYEQTQASVSKQLTVQKQDIGLPTINNNRISPTFSFQNLNLKTGLSLPQQRSNLGSVSLSRQILPSIQNFQPVAVGIKTVQLKEVPVAQNERIFNQGFKFGNFDLGVRGSFGLFPDTPSLGGFAFPKGRSIGFKSNEVRIAPSFSAIVQDIKIKNPIKASKTFGVNPFTTRGLLVGKNSKKNYFKLTDI